MTDKIAQNTAAIQEMVAEMDAPTLEARHAAHTSEWAMQESAKTWRAYEDAKRDKRMWDMACKVAFMLILAQLFGYVLAALLLKFLFHF